MLSIVISWKNRHELSQSLPSIIESAEKVNGEVLIINYDGDKELLKKQLHLFNKLSVVNIDNEKYFNKSIAQNIGAHYAKFEHLFFCDCDIILDSNETVALFHKVLSNTESFGTLIGVKETKLNSINNNHIISFGYELKIKTKDGKTLNIVDSEEDASDGSRNAPGLLMTSKKNFHKINGYNSSLHGWGWEDQDMISRLTLGAGLERIFYGKALHVSHNDHFRTQYYPTYNRWESRDKMFRTALSNYDNNDFNGTYLDDIKRVNHHVLY